MSDRYDTIHYSNPALAAELAYRRERLQAGRSGRTGHRHWFRARRRTS